MNKNKYILPILVLMTFPLTSYACEGGAEKNAMCKHHNSVSSHANEHQLESSQPTLSAFQNKNNMAMADMHRGMAEVKFTNNDDVDFMALMIPHHEGAIKMAEIILQTSNDKEVRNLAHGIITEQRNEIRIMQHLIEAKKNEKN